MKITNLALALAVLGLCTFKNASAIEEPDVANGNFWYEQCSPQKSAAERGFCYTYIIGVIDGAISQAAFSNSQAVICRPDGVTTGQLADIFHAFLAKNPESRHLAPGVLLMASIMKAFPCPKTPSPPSSATK